MPYYFKVAQMRAIGFVDFVGQLHFQTFFNILIYHFDDKAIDLTGSFRR